LVFKPPISREHTCTEGCEKLEETPSKVKTPIRATRALDDGKKSTKEPGLIVEDHTSSVIVAVVCLSPICMTIFLKQLGPG